MIKTILVVTLAVTAGQASALSCRFGDAAEAYNQAQNHGDDFIAVIGQLDWVPFGPYPDYNGFAMEFEGQDHIVEGQFTGGIIAENGIRTPIDGPVTIVSHCINGDCGYAYSGAEMLSFIHTVAGAPTIYAYPCQSYPTTPTPDGIKQIQACVDGGPCVGTWQH